MATIFLVERSLGNGMESHVKSSAHLSNKEFLTLLREEQLLYRVWVVANQLLNGYIHN